MARNASLRQLTNRLHQIEEEVRSLRWDLEAYTEETPASPQKTPRLPRVETAVLRKWSEELFRDLPIEDRRLGALEVQEMSRTSGLAPNELSRSLIQARDE